jgi:hypothetical protein
VRAAVAVVGEFLVRASRPGDACFVVMHPNTVLERQA